MIRQKKGGFPPVRLATVTLTTALLLSSSVVEPTLAQTSMSPPGKPRATPNTQHNQVPAAPKRPVTETMLNDAEDNAEGFYPDMMRSGVGGQIQDAWNESKVRQGVHKFRLCDDCVYKVRTRELMSTTILLPTDAEIISADLGDPKGFKVKVKARNMVSVKPASYGIDTNLNIYTKSGAIYPFYLRAESFNSIHVPDVLVKLIGEEAPSLIESAVSYGPSSSNEDGKRQQKAGGLKDKTNAAIDGLNAPNANNGDFVRTVEFDPAELHGWNDYNLYGDELIAHDKLTIFRDKRFTYIKVDKDVWDSIELPVAYVVIDGVDELVNTRVQGTTFIIESTAKLISLKAGKKYMCVKYTGEDA